MGCEPGDFAVGGGGGRTSGVVNGYDRSYGSRPDGIDAEGHAHYWRTSLGNGDLDDTNFTYYATCVHFTPVNS